MKQLLLRLDACSDAVKWAENKSLTEIYRTCHRGDWMLWLHQRTNPDDVQIRTLAAGHCANTVRHLMRDDRSKAAVDAAIAFGDGKISQIELAAAAWAARAAAWAADAEGWAAERAARAARAADAADAAWVAAAAWEAAGEAKSKNQQETADIVRKYIPFEKFNINI